MNIVTPIVRDPNQEKFDTRRLLAHAQQQAEDRKYEDFMIIDVDAHRSLEHDAGGKEDRAVARQFGAQQRGDEAGDCTIPPYLCGEVMSDE